MIDLHVPRRIHLAYLALVFVIIFQNCFAFNPICDSKACKSLANQYVSNLDKSVNPCTDFYKFACGGWEKKYNDILRSFYTMDDTMEDNVYKDLKNLMESREKGSNSKDVQNAKAAYMACINTPHMDRSPASVIKETLAKVSPWPLLYPKNIQPRIIAPCRSMDRQYIQLTGESAFYDYKIIADNNDYSRIITDLGPMETPFGVILRIAPFKGSEVLHYMNFLKLIIKKLSPNYSILPMDGINGQLSLVLQFRMQLRQINKDTRKLLPSQLTIKEFQDWYNTQARSRKNAEINWLEVIRTIRKSEIPRSSIISPNSYVNVNLKYFSRLADLLASTNIQVLVNHMHLYFVERHLEFDPQMRNELKQSYHDGFPVNGMIRYDRRRWRKCLEEHSMSKILKSLYAKEYFSQEKQNDVGNLIEEAKRLLERQIFNSNWLDKLTKEQSIDKTKNIKSIIGSNEWFGPNATALNDPGTSINPLEVYVSYNLKKNIISVSAAELQVPAYDKSFPYAIKYGGLMYAIGHELYHAIDKDGTKYTKHGIKPWWSSAMRSELHKQGSCIRDQFQEYRKRQLQKRGLILLDDMPDTSDEDIADVMGLKLAYVGFKQKLEERHGSCPILPGLEEFGCEKLFFIAFANIHCMSPSPRFKQRLLMEDNHSIPEVRVNGAVANIRQFTNVFECKQNDPMKLQKKCDIWKK